MTKKNAEFIKLHIGEKLAQLEKTQGRVITPTDIARAIGVSHNTILSYVNSDYKQTPSILILMKLAKYFDCSVDDLVEYIGEIEEEDLRRAS